jgi:hypothetical protein
VKKWIFLSSLFIFIINFPLHFLYDICPNFITSIFTPVNESIFEHMKMIFTSYLLIGIIYSFYYKNSKYLASFLITSIICTCIYLVIFIPVYVNIGENMIFTISLLFICILISQIGDYYIVNLLKRKYQNLISFGIILIFLIISVVFTYNPPHMSFFIDPTNLSYGISKNK